MLTLRIPQIPKPPPPPPETPAEEKAPTLARPALATPRFGRGLTTLSVSWMHGRFEAVAINRGELTGRWEKADVTDDPAKFGELIREAVTATSYRGSTVNLLLAHPRLTHQLIETPPARGAALKAVVQRQVERLKGFEGPPAWSFQAALPTKNSHRVLVHLLPWSLLELLVTSVQRAGLHLVSVTPCTAVVHSQIARLPLAIDEVVLVAAASGALTTVVVGRQDGQLLLARSLDTARNEGNDVAVDLSRTLLFVSQQFGANVSGVWLFGPGMPERLPDLQTQLQVPVKLIPESQSPCFWAEEAARLPADNTPNLVSSEQRKAPQRRVLLRMTLFLGLLLLAGAIVTAVLCEFIARGERANIRGLEQRMVELRNRHEEFQRTQAQMQKRGQFTAEVLDGRLAPVPFWFMAYLSDAVPPGLVVTNLTVNRTGSLWSVHLSGRREKEGHNAARASDPVDAFRQRLSDGPFHMTPGSAQSGSPSSAGAVAGSSSIASWAARLSQGAGSSSAVPFAADGFVIEGTMQ